MSRMAQKREPRAAVRRLTPPALCDTVGALMKASERALSVFRQPPALYNCAQTICAAFGRDDLLDLMKNRSGGRAEGGLCGALYAAQYMAGPEHAADIIEGFRAACGAVCCRDLEGGEPRVDCRVCVGTAADLLVRLQGAS